MTLAMSPLADLMTGLDKSAATAVGCQHSLCITEDICVLSSECWLASGHSGWQGLYETDCMAESRLARAWQRPRK